MPVRKYHSGRGAFVDVYKRQSFVSAIKEPELVQYLKERNLYINEPVEVEGEV